MSAQKTAPAPAPAKLPPYRALPVADLVEFAGNPRTHSPGQVDKIAASIREFGFTNPILIDGKRGIIAGHGRLLAAQQLGLVLVPTIELRGLSDAQKRAYVIADNKLALDAGWDNDLLASMMLDLRVEGFDLALTGFDTLEQAALLGGDGLGGSGAGAGSLAAQFGIPPFSVLNAREGWWQDRKRAWLALGIQSEIGRGDQPGTPARVGPDDEATYRTIGGRKPNAIPGGGAMPLDRPGYAVPGGALMPAADYSKRQRGDGRGRAI